MSLVLGIEDEAHEAHPHVRGIGYRFERGTSERPTADGRRRRRQP